MTPKERTVGGLRCSEVLAALSEYLDGELTGSQAGRIEEHLRGCDWCESFGGAMKATVAELRKTLADPGAPPDDVAARLWSRLRQPGTD